MWCRGGIRLAPVGWWVGLPAGWLSGSVAADSGRNPAPTQYPDGRSNKTNTNNRSYKISNTIITSIPTADQAEVDNDAAANFGGRAPDPGRTTERQRVGPTSFCAGIAHRRALRCISAVPPSTSMSFSRLAGVVSGLRPCVCLRPAGPPASRPEWIACSPFSLFIACRVRQARRYRFHPRRRRKGSAS